MITNKRHQKIIKGYQEEIEHKDQTINDYLAKILRLEKELDEARNLKAILEKLYPIADWSSKISSFFDLSSSDIRLPDNVLVYDDDLFGGKVIKQEGNKAIKIDKNGCVKTGITKSKCDKGYSYKLIRE